MKLKNPLLAVRDMERSKTFYREVLGLHVVMDFGANVTLTGGLCLQTLDTWTDFLGKEAEEIRFGANDSEVYFEEDDFVPGPGHDAGADRRADGGALEVRHRLSALRCLRG